MNFFIEAHAVSNWRIYILEFSGTFFQIVVCKKNVKMTSFALVVLGHFHGLATRCAVSKNMVCSKGIDDKRSIFKGIHDLGMMDKS